MDECMQCGALNQPGSRFCGQCGSSLQPPGEPRQTIEGPHEVIPSQATVPAEKPGMPLPAPEVTQTPTMPQEPAGRAGGEAPLIPGPGEGAPQRPATPPPGPVPPAQEAPAYPPQPPQGYGTVPPAAPAGTYGRAQPPRTTPRRSRSPIFWVGGAIVFVSGILILISTWLSWAQGPAGFFSLSGWDWYNLGKSGSSLAGAGETYNAFFMYTSGYPFFTGLCSLIVGGVIAFFAALMLGLRLKGLAVLTLILSIIALGIAITNLTTILRTGNVGPGLSDSIRVGIGMYIFLIFSALGLGGSVAALVG